MEPQLALMLEPTHQAKRNVGLRFGDIASGAAAVALLVGATLKASAAWKAPAELGTWVLIGFEIAVAASLILGSRWMWPKVLAGAVFAAFATVALRLHVDGATSCGCFGAVAVRPLWIGITDAILSLSLLLAAWLSNRRPIHHVVLVTATMGALIIGWLLPLSWISPSPAVQTAWIGRSLSSVVRTDIDSDLSRGRWSVLFYRGDCPSCRVKLVQLARQAASDPTRRGAVVVLPSGKHTNDAHLEGVLVGQLLSSAAPPIPSTLLELVDGVVVADNTQSAAEKAPQAADLAARTTRSADGTFFADLGYVASGARVRIEMSSQDLPELMLKQPNIECSCTTIVHQPAQFGGDAIDNILIDFAAPTEAQVYSKGIVWETNAPSHPQIRFRLRARVGLPLRLDPPEIKLSRSAAHAQQSIRLHNDSDTPVSVRAISGDGATVHATVPTDAIAPRESIELKLGALPAHSDRGSDQYRVSVKTDVRDQPLLQVVVNLVP